MLAVSISAYYRVGPDPVVSVTRVILQIGYNTIRDIAIAAELAEMAQKRPPHAVKLHRMFAKSFLAGHEAKALGAIMHLRQAEECFTTTLLHSLAEFVLACFLPEDSARPTQVMTEARLSYD